MRRRIIGAAVTAAMLLSAFAISPVAAAQAPVGLGTAGAYAVLAGSTATNTGPTVVNGDLGVSPGSAVVGFPPGLVNGTINAGDAAAAQAQSDLTIAYNDAAGRPCDVNLTGQDLGGLTLTAGAYCFSSSAQLTGTVTLDAQGDPNAVFIFQVGTTLTTASASSVSLINGAQACRAYWQIGSSATLGTATSFIGNILALQSITLTTGVTVDGRALARNGAVTMDTNVITRATCVPPETTECTSTLTGGTYEAISVPDGETCTLLGVTVEGDVTVGDDSKLVTKAQTDIGGDVTGVGAQAVQLYNTNVAGDVDLSGTTGQIIIGPNTCSVDPIVGGSIRLHDNFGSIAVCQVSVGERLVLRRNQGSIGLFANIVAENLIVSDNTGPAIRIRGNTVSGYVLVNRNTLTELLAIRGNDVAGDLRCFGNTPSPMHSRNTVGGLRLGQCSDPE